MIQFQDMVNFSTRDRVLAWLPGITSDDGKAQVQELVIGYSRLMSEELDRLIKYRQRTMLFDVPENGVMDLHLRAWPIGVDALTGDPLVSVYNDNGGAPSYTTPLTYPNQYRVYTDEEHQGRIEFLISLLSGPQALKVVWTGGMAPCTIVEGADGTLANPGADGDLTSTSATFETDLVQAGMTVTASNGTITETKEIKSVDSETKLTVDGTWLAPLVGASRVWIVNEAGLVGNYPDLEMALIVQSVFHWKQRDKLDIAAMSVQGGSGMNVTMTKFKPMEFLPEVQTAIYKHRLTVYP